MFVEWKREKRMRGVMNEGMISERLVEWKGEGKGGNSGMNSDGNE